MSTFVSSFMYETRTEDFIYYNVCSVSIVDGKIEYIEFSSYHYYRSIIKFTRNEFYLIPTFMKLQQNYIDIKWFELKLLDYYMKNGLEIKKGREVPKIQTIDHIFSYDKCVYVEHDNLAEIESLFLKYFLTEEYLGHYCELIKTIINKYDIYKIRYSGYFNESEQEKYNVIIELQSGDCIRCNVEHNKLYIPTRLFIKHANFIPKIIRDSIRYFYDNKYISTNIFDNFKLGLRQNVFNFEYSIRDKKILEYKLYYTHSIHYKKILLLLFKNEKLCDFLANDRFTLGSRIEIFDREYYCHLRVREIDDIRWLLKEPIKAKEVSRNISFMLTSSIEKRHNGYEYIETIFDDVTLAVEYFS